MWAITSPAPTSYLEEHRDQGPLPASFKNWSQIRNTVAHVAAPICEESNRPEIGLHTARSGFIVISTHMLDIHTGKLNVVHPGPQYNIEQTYKHSKY